MKMKCGNVIGLDDVIVKMIIKSGKAMIVWLLMMCNVCYLTSKVDWKRTCIVPTYRIEGRYMNAGI